jgi:hypothetical protein
MNAVEPDDTAPLIALGYAACEVPSNLLLYRFGARGWLSESITDPPTSAAGPTMNPRSW